MTTDVTILDTDESVLARRLAGVWRDASGRQVDSVDAAAWEGLALGDLTPFEVWPDARVRPDDVAKLAAEVAAIRLARRRAERLYWAKKRGG